MPDVVRRQVIRGLYVAVVALFLGCFGRFYDPRYGFTALIQFQTTEAEELPAVRAVPHQRLTRQSGGGYDGQFYAQMAIEPLLRDPLIDRALDNPAYRARRILFSWTAWIAGLGRPAWILQAYAIQNAAFWLLLACLLARWLPPTSLENFAAWFACLYTHGMLVSVRLALIDGPSTALIALAMTALCAHRPWLAAATLGISGLGRETNLLSAVAMAPGLQSVAGHAVHGEGPSRPQARTWRRRAARVVGQGLLVILPLALWLDYVRSIYWATPLAGGDHLITPFTAWFRAWQTAFGDLRAAGWTHPARHNLLVLAALTTQAGYLLWIRRWRDAWWRVGIAYGALMLSLHAVVWEGYPGAMTRIALPLTLAFNLLLPRTRWFWPLVIIGNLAVVPGLVIFDVPVVSRIL
jgi:hypothetical protein